MLGKNKRHDNKLPDEFITELTSLQEVAENERAGKKDWKILNGIEAQTAVVNAGRDFWRGLHAWATDRRLLSSKDDGILQAAQQMPKNPIGETVHTFDGDLGKDQERRLFAETEQRTGVTNRKVGLLQRLPSGMCPICLK